MALSKTRSSTFQEEEAQWWDMYSLLLEYKEAEGSYNVPKDHFVNNSETGNSMALGLWLAQQKKELELMSEDKYFALTQLAETGLLWTSKRKKISKSTIADHPETALNFSTHAHNSSSSVLTTPHLDSHHSFHTNGYMHTNQSCGEQMEEGRQERDASEHLIDVDSIADCSLIAFLYSECAAPQLSQVQLGIGCVACRLSRDEWQLSHLLVLAKDGEDCDELRGQYEVDVNSAVVSRDCLLAVGIQVEQGESYSCDGGSCAY